VIVDAPRIEGARISSRRCPRSRARPLTSAFTDARGDLEQARGRRCRAFDYLYSDEELHEWVRPLRDSRSRPEQAYAFFTNNATSPDVAAVRPREPITSAARVFQWMTA